MGHWPASDEFSRRANDVRGDVLWRAGNTGLPDRGDTWRWRHANLLRAVDARDSGRLSRFGDPTNLGRAGFDRRRERGDALAGHPPLDASGGAAHCPGRVLQPFSEFRSGDRSAEEVALGLITPEGYQRVTDVLPLHPLGHDL